MWSIPQEIKVKKMKVFEALSSRGPRLGVYSKKKIKDLQYFENLPTLGDGESIEFIDLSQMSPPYF